MKKGQTVIVDGRYEGTIIGEVDSNKYLVRLTNGFTDCYCVNRIQKINENTDNKIMNEWELARLMLSEDENVKKLCDSLQMQPIDIIKTYSAKEIMAMLDKIANQIQVDDVVSFVSINGQERVGVVTKVNNSYYHAIILTLTGSFVTMPLSKLRKTGTNIPIMEFLNEQMKNMWL